MVRIIPINFKKSTFLFDKVKIIYYYLYMGGILRKSLEYLEFIRSRGCIICDQLSVPHHVRSLTTIPYTLAGGTGLKPSDYVTVPLCPVHHEEIHISQDLFEKNYGLCLHKEIITCLVEYICQKLSSS